MNAGIDSWCVRHSGVVGRALCVAGERYLDILKEVSLVILLEFLESRGCHGWGAALVCIDHKNSQINVQTNN